MVHWQTGGLAGGRQGHLLFHAPQYRDNYVDLAPYDNVQLATHYLQYGIGELRKGYS